MIIFGSILLFISLLSNPSESFQVCPSLETLGFTGFYDDIPYWRWPPIIREMGSIFYGIDYLAEKIPLDELKKRNLTEMFENLNFREKAYEKADSITEYRNRTIKYYSYYYDESTCRIKNETNAQYIWTSNVLSSSRFILSLIDEVNVFLNVLQNGDDLKENFECKSGSRYGCYWTRNYVTGTLTEVKNELEKIIFKTFPEIQKNAELYAIYAKFMNCAPKLATEIYKEASVCNRTLVKLLTEMVTEEKFVEITTEISNALENILISDRSPIRIEKIYKMFLNKVLDIDPTDFTTKLYRTFLSFRVMFLHLDGGAIYQKIINIQTRIGWAEYETHYGKWPEMSKFIDNFLRLTIGSKDAWMKLNILYEAALTKYQEELSAVELEVESVFNGFFEVLLDILKQVVDDEDVGAAKIFKRLTNLIYFDFYQFYDLLNSLIYFDKIVADRLQDIDFDALKNILAENETFKLFQDVLFSNWPENEAYPESLDTYVESVFEDVKQLIIIFSEAPFLTSEYAPYLYSYYTYIIGT